MRVAFFLNQFPLVSETFVLHQIEGMLARGYQPDIYAMAADGAGCDHPAFLEWKMGRHIRARLAISHDKPKIAAFVLVNLALKHPVLFVRCAFQCLRQRAGNPVMLFAAAFSSSGIPFKPASYDAIHAHFADTGLLALRLRKLGIINGPVLTSFHGVDVTQHRSARNVTALQQLFREGDAFTHPSDYIGKCAQTLGCPSSKQQKLYCGVNTSKFQFQERRLSADSPVHIVSVARLVEKKGLYYAIEAVVQLIENGKNVIYDIVGDGPLRASLETLIQKSGFQQRIHLLGAQDGDVVRRLLGEAHIFLLPSVTAKNGDMEGLPVSILEAQMCGLPVVSTFHSGIPEGVEKDRSAFLVNERDTKSLAERLGYLVDNPDVWPAMGRAGRIFVEERFDINKLNDDLVEIYRSLSSSTRQRTPISPALSTTPSRLDAD